MDVLGSVMLYPLAICGASIITSIIGTFFVKLGTNGSIMGALYKGLIVTGVLSIIGLGGATSLTIGWGEIAVDGKSITGTNLFICGIVGLVVTALIVVITEYYTGTNKRPVNSISQASVTGHGTNVIQGLAVSLESTALPAIVIVGGIIVTYQLGRPVRHRHRGHGHARHRRHDRGARRFRPGHRQCRRHRRNVGSRSGSPQVDRRARRRRQHHQGGHQGLRDRFRRSWRAGAVCGLLERPGSSLPRRTRKVPYFKDMGDISFSLSNPYVVAGLIFGGLIPYLFGGIAMTAVGRAAGAIVEEVRRQFKEKPGIMEGKEVRTMPVRWTF
jgi:K(+)-stimulated pyrophosphate-energized sodium pump